MLITFTKTIRPWTMVTTSFVSFGKSCQLISKRNLEMRLKVRSIIIIIFLILFYVVCAKFTFIFNCFMLLFINSIIISPNHIYGRISEAPTSLA